MLQIEPIFNERIAIYTRFKLDPFETSPSQPPKRFNDVSFGKAIVRVGHSRANSFSLAQTGANHVTKLLPNFLHSLLFIIWSMKP